LRPDYLEVNFKMGVIFFSKNRLEQAAAEFQRAAILPDLAAYCAAFLAMIYARLEQPQLAEMSVRKAAQLDPRCDLLWMAWNDLGLAWYSNKNGARALVAYGEATRLKPEEPGTWFNLGVTHHQAGDLEAARGAYRRAVELRDSLGGAWHNLGIVCAELGDLDAAATAFARETHLAPKNVRAWYDLGVTCEKLGRTEEARIAFARAEVFSGAEPSSSLVDNPNEDNPAVFETAPLKKEGSSLP
jgi:Flp pilus assembly protein TadD